MGLLDWFRRRRKNSLGIKTPKEEEALDRTGKLRTEIEEKIEEPKRKGKRKKESV